MPLEVTHNTVEAACRIGWRDWERQTATQRVKNRKGMKRCFEAAMKQVVRPPKLQVTIQSFIEKLREFAAECIKPPAERRGCVKRNTKKTDLTD